MARIVFEVDVKADADRVVEALDREEGIKSWWTADAEFEGGVGATMTLGFPIAPEPFRLRVEEVGSDRVRWRSVGAFPPHWVDTEVVWMLSANPDGGTKISFAHEGWADDTGPFAMSAYTWAQLLDRLKSLVETGSGTPLFVDAAQQPRAGADASESPQ